MNSKLSDRSRTYPRARRIGGLADLSAAPLKGSCSVDRSQSEPGVKLSARRERGGAVKISADLGPERPGGVPARHMREMDRGVSPAAKPAI